MGSKFMVMEKSAWSYNSKACSMAQEVKRRLLNTSENVPQGDRDVILNNFADKYINSGYSRTQIRAFIVDRIKGYEKAGQPKWQGQEGYTGGRSPHNRTGSSTTC